MPPLPLVSNDENLFSVGVMPLFFNNESLKLDLMPANPGLKNPYLSGLQVLDTRGLPLWLYIRKVLTAKYSVKVLYQPLSIMLRTGITTDLGYRHLGSSVPYLKDLVLQQHHTHPSIQPTRRTSTVLRTGMTR